MSPEEIIMRVCDAAFTGGYNADEDEIIRALHAAGYKIMPREPLISEHERQKLIAQGMRDAVKLSGEGWTIDYILARAQELDPQGKSPSGLTVDNHDGSELIVENGGGFICDPRTI